MTDVGPDPCHGLDAEVADGEVVEGEALDADPPTHRASVTVETLVTDLERVAARARPVPRRLPPRRRRTSRTTSKQSPTPGRGRARSAAGLASSSGCCPCSTPATPPSCTAPMTSGADRRRAARRRSRRRGWSGSTPSGEPFDPDVAEAVVHEPGDGGEPRRGRGAAGGLPLEGPVLRPAMVQGQRTERRAMAAAARVVREGLLQGARRVGRRRPPKEITRRTASWRASTTPTPTRRRRRRGAVQGGLGRLRRASATRASARSTTRSAGSARPAAGFPGGGRRVPGGFTLHRRAATSATCSAACSAGGGPAAAARRRHGARGPQRGQDLEAELHLDVRRRRRTASPPPSTSRATRRAAPATARAPSPARRPHAVPNCGGPGVVSDNQGLFSLSLAVPAAARAGACIDRRPVPHLPGHAASSAARAR